MWTQAHTERRISHKDMNAGKWEHCSCTSRNTSSGRQRQKLGGGKARFFPDSQRKCGLADTSISDFQPRKLWDKFLLYWATRFVPLWCGNPRKLTQWMILSLLPRTSTKPSLILSYLRGKDFHPCVSAGTTAGAELGHILLMPRGISIHPSLSRAPPWRLASQGGLSGLSTMSWWGQKNKTQLNAVTPIHFKLGIST